MNLEGCVIIDTGSPVSFHQSGAITFAGEVHKCARSIPGVDPNAMSEELNQKILGLIGMDIMTKYDNIVFDYHSGQITIDAVIDDRCLSVIPSYNIMGASAVDLLIEGKTARMFMDTGAPTSYISPQFIIGQSALEHVHDYHPFYGEFWSDTYQLTTKIQGNDVKMNFGTLPAILQRPINMMGADGVIGYDLFSRFKLMYKQGNWFFVNKNSND